MYIIKNSKIETSSFPIIQDLCQLITVEISTDQLIYLLITFLSTFRLADTGQNLNYQIIFQFLEHDIKQKVYGRVCDNERMRQMVDMNKPIWPL